MEMFDIIESLNRSSLFELFKIKCAIDKMLDDPDKLRTVRSLLRINQEIRYFDASLNCEIPATIERMNKNTVFCSKYP